MHLHKYAKELILVPIILSLLSCEKAEIVPKKLGEKEPHYAVAVLPTPVLNTPDFRSVFGGKDGKTLKLNKNNLMVEVEFIALIGAVFVIEEKIKKDGHEILKVKTEDYPYPTKKSYYIDSRFVEKKLEKPQERIKRLPEKEAIINSMLSAKGAVYIWGGDYVRGIPEMLEFYPVKKKAPSELSNRANKPSTELPEDIKDRWMLKGVDCSGLLYEATDGYTPRNVESLFYFGRPVDIKGLGSEEIIKKLKPLDIIVYKRHVLIVLSKKEVIESTITKGVHVKGLKKALKAISKNTFVVRRWHPE